VRRKIRKTDILAAFDIDDQVFAGNVTVSGVDDNVIVLLPAHVIASVTEYIIRPILVHEIELLARYDGEFVARQDDLHVFLVAEGDRDRFTPGEALQLVVPRGQELGLLRLEYNRLA
jgi:hypothetical protein